jgi:hypothetical protein
VCEKCLELLGVVAAAAITAMLIAVAYDVIVTTYEHHRTEIQCDR